MLKPILMVALVMATAGTSSPTSGDSAASAQALNPCALLKTDDVQSLAAKETVADGVSSSLQPFGSVTCRYAWGVGANSFKVDITVHEASRMFPGMSPEQIKQRVLGSVRAGTADAVVADVGEAAVFKAESALYAGATAVVKGHVVEVHADGFVAREMKDQVIALLKSAVSRL